VLGGIENCGGGDARPRKRQIQSRYSAMRLGLVANEASSPQPDFTGTRAPTSSIFRATTRARSALGRRLFGPPWHYAPESLATTPSVGVCLLPVVGRSFGHAADISGVSSKKYAGHYSTIVTPEDLPVSRRSLPGVQRAGFLGGYMSCWSVLFWLDEASESGAVSSCRVLS